LNVFDKIKTALYHAATVAHARYHEDELSLRATSLTYSTLLSLVPFLAVMFSVLKSFGVQNFIEPLLAQALEPLGPNASELTKRIIGFVAHVQVGVLGAAGLAMLFYTVVSLVSNIEDSLNQIWRLPRSRTWGERFTAYLSIVLVGPVLVFTALALTASAQSYWLVARLAEVHVIDQLFTLLTKIVPFILLCATFTFIYKLLPYTRVRFLSALVGGISAGILWQLVGTGFAAFVANSARYTAIYSGFAVLIVFLIWLYVGWLIFLIGAEIAYFHQHPYAFARESRNGGRGHLFRQWLALSALVEVTRRHLSGSPPCQPNEIAAALGVSGLGNMVDEFVQNGILLRSAEPPGIALARPPEDISVQEVLKIVNGGEIQELNASGPVVDLLARQQQSIQKTNEGTNLKVLASEGREKPVRVAQLKRHRNC
jgi:membrane protein